MEYWWLLSAIGFLGTIHYLWRNNTFFQKHGVIHVPSFPILGVMAPVIFRRISFVAFTQRIYNFNTNAKYIGFYAMTNPVILFRDLELIKSIFVKNFEVLPDRPSFVDSSDFLIAQNLFNLNGEKWKNMRNLSSVCFTSGMMKTIFKSISECAVNFTKSLGTLSAHKKEVDMKDLFTRYTNDIIAICVYGVKIDSMKNPTNKFYLYAKDMTDTSSVKIFAKFLFLRTFPRLFHLLNLRLVLNHVSSFFKNIQTMPGATHDAKSVKCSNMIQLMMNMTNKKDQKKLNVDKIAAQAFKFLFAGFETTATTLSFAAHEIAINSEVQTKLRREIDEVLEKSNFEDVTYEIINRLEYLDAVVNETLRFYAPTFVERRCNKTYTLPPALPNEKPFVMQKGMICWVPVYAIHHDEKYFDDPDRFYPERFLQNKTYYNSSGYMPFGLGPRRCLADRFAVLMIKVLLFYLLARYDLKPCAKTLPFRFSKKSVIMKPEGGFWLNIQHRHRNDASCVDTEKNLV